MLAASRAGERVVAVGDHGVILLSDDSKTFRQARSVPIASTLTGLTFVDARHGWAVGHWGAILSTTDGGETWALKRSDLSVDQPLFGVYFRTPLDGIAVGLWSLMLQTHDGGNSWSTVTLPAAPGSEKADRNLYSIFGRGEEIFVTAEKGAVLKSSDGGDSWRYLETGFKGSLWSGAAASDRVCVAGLRAKLLCSPDAGATWSPSDLPTTSSITAVMLQGGVVTVGTLDGTLYDVVEHQPRPVEYKGEGAVMAIQPSSAGMLVFGTAGVSLVAGRRP